MANNRTYLLNHTLSRTLCGYDPDEVYYFLRKAADNLSLPDGNNGSPDG
jgi:hypothetical protein